MNTKHIQFLSASDRLNYGDLLFPIITKTIISQNLDIDFKNYALIRTNLSKFGALPTESYGTFENENDKDSVIIIGGGHVIFSNWNTLYGHINKFYLKFRKFRIFNFVFGHLNFPRILFTKSRTISPFAPYDLKGDLVYLSVGGNFNNHSSNKKIVNMFKNCALLSVRDNMLYGQICHQKINVYKVPDTAVLLSKLFPKNELSKKISNNLNFDITKKYIIVQLGLHKGPNDHDCFIRDINFFKRKGFRILCMPIGLASDHEDDKVLKELIKKDKDWLYYCPKNIYEIMYLISYADWFFGTSLHGCITAFAYNTPFVPLNKKVKKLNNYTTTWWTPFIKESIDYIDLSEYLKKETKVWNKSLALKALQEQEDLVLKNYDSLIALLKQQ